MFAEERRGRWKETATAAEEVKREFKTAPSALESRLLARVDRRIGECVAETNERACALGDVQAREHREQVDGAVAEVRRGFAAQLVTGLAALEQRVVQMVVQRIGRQDSKDVDPQAVARLVGEQIEEPIHAFICSQGAAEFAALEQRLKAVPHQTEQQADNQRWAAIDQRLKRLEDMNERFGPSELHEAQCAIESKFEAELEQLEQRLKAVPGRLPPVKIWRAEMVVYQAELIAHDGALWQAKCDTAQKPGGADWVLIARAGRDAVTPTIRGTYSVDEKYRQLDIVAQDGGAFIARKDNPGICPGPDWQMIAQRGKRGRSGVTGPRGAPGEKGAPGKDGGSLYSWQIDRRAYRVSPLMSNGIVGPMLELRPFYEQLLDDLSTWGYFG
jgi:hypothetical protein